MYQFTHICKKWYYQVDLFDFMCIFSTSQSIVCVMNNIDSLFEQYDNILCSPYIQGRISLHVP